MPGFKNAPLIFHPGYTVALRRIASTSTCNGLFAKAPILLSLRENNGGMALDIRPYYVAIHSRNAHPYSR
jgi:hypothetical protein